MTHKHVFLLCILWGVCTYGAAQISDVIPGSSAIAHTSVARNDTWSAFHNPAALVQQERFQLAFQYENKYLIANLSTYLLQAAYSNRYVNVGISYSFFGYSVYSEMMTAVTLARSFGRFSLGLQGNIISIYGGQSIGYRTTAVPQLGVNISLTDNLSLGFQTFNPFLQSVKLTETKRPIPAVYSVGTDYRFYKGMRWDVQIDYNTHAGLQIATGYEWQAIHELCVKIGVYYQKYVVGCLGVGLNFADFKADLNAEWHPVLGVNLLCKVAYVWH